MSSEPTAARNRLIVPIVALVILLLVSLAFFLTRGDDGEAPAAVTPTRTTTPAAIKPATAKLTGSGDAPAAIALDAATVARSTTGIGLAADIPKIDLKEFATVTLVVGQDDGAVLWKLSTLRDPRGAFTTPELRREKGGGEQQFACSGSSLRIKATRMTFTLPLQCLNNQKKPVRARLELTDVDGGTETTAMSKVLSAPK